MAMEPDSQEKLYAGDEDTRLMLSFREGSTEAFEQLVNRNQERVFRLAQRYVGEPAWAEDITQDVFIRVFNAAKSYQPTARFSTWVYRITVNLCLNALRDSHGRPEVPLETDPEGVLEAEETSEMSESGETLESEELSEAVSRAVASLPDWQRTVLLLRRYEEMSYEEISEVTGKAPTAVKSLLARARQNLKTVLRKYLER
jgi:RNA polymerase sigma-70 factor (ECF subfamily)